MRSLSSHRSTPPARRGAVLILVLVVVVLLSLSAYRFADSMVTEQQAVQSTNRSLQLRAAADSGIEAAAALLEDRDARLLEPLTGNTKRFQNVVVSGQDSTATRFTVVNQLEPHSASPGDRPDQIGLVNESSRLNLNTLPLELHRRKEARTSLMALPRMTAPIADAILDWMDADDSPTTSGAESSYYLSLRPPRWPKQARLESIEELLSVRGVTKELLYGPNRQGPHNDRTTSRETSFREPEEAAWIDLVTITSREGNLRRNGSRKLNINHPDLVELYDELVAEFDTQTATFIVAWRLAGSTDGAKPNQNEPDIHDQSEEAKQARIEAARLRAKAQLGGIDDPAIEPNDLPKTPPSAPRKEILRGGLDLSQRPAFSFDSLVDLIGTAVRIDVNHQQTILASPWKSDPASLSHAWETLSERLSVTDADVIPGKININEAPLAVLLAVPGMDEQLAAAILARRRDVVGTSAMTRRQQSPTWLVEERLIDKGRLRKLAPYITTGGDVYRGVSIGHADGMRNAVGLKFLIDATRSPARVLELRDVTASFSPLPR